jgi:hypothetical protein
MGAAFDRMPTMTDHSNAAAALASSDFERQLRCLAHTSSGPYLRPFTPDARWRDARVFVVGTNPATPLRDEFGSFDAYWDALTRDPTAFQAVYRTQRSGKPSRTTGRIERFAAPLEGVGVLRTNAAALPSERWKKLPAKVRHEQLEIGRQILRALVEICPPAAILCHGQEGVQAVSTLFATVLDPYVPLGRQVVRASLAVGAAPVQLFAYPHLSGLGVQPGFAVGHMDEELLALGRRLASELDV